MIVAIPVRSDSGDFFLPVLAQDDQRIFRIVFSRGRRSVSIGRLNLSERSNVQVSLTKPGGTALLHAVPLASIKKMQALIAFLRNTDITLSKIRAG